jgi:hypothetical protein
VARRKTIRARRLTETGPKELLKQMDSAVKKSGVATDHGASKFDPLDTLSALAADKTVRVDVRLKAAQDLADRIYPKVKTVETAGPEEEPITVTIASYANSDGKEKTITIPRRRT